MQQDYKPNAGEHPITPPLALIDQWWDEAKQNAKYDEPIGPLVATQAAQWGADQELEACCVWVEANFGQLPAHNLHQFRRPEPPSRKEQALEAVSRLCASVIHDDLKNDAAIVRRALEQLPDAL